ncbi:FAD binding domain-containing protein [Amylocarpus encephaloides]|uniref:FAD binding domain-containing protein n=1 Tax=Amylocarpus encephaloides TaxID=45428 RepID=A0A9P7Y940_9HELO|nr:FAD binding domain-containing protein [Amylocarpus encephaloides]
MEFSILLLLGLLASCAHGSSSDRQDDYRPLTFKGQRYSCKCYNGDRCWPSKKSWDALNKTVNGNLQAVVPRGNVCYEKFGTQSTYNADQCTKATEDLTVGVKVVTDPIAPFWPFYSNNTCDPLPNVSNKTCTLGYLPEYVILAKTVAHIQAGVKFSAKKNLRLVIRNTGHDFMSRSTGFGALAINTHDFDSISFTTKYKGPGAWRGGAVTMGAGVMIKDVYNQAYAQTPKVVVVGGECPTVGMAGGYIQGGGHGPLSGIHGLAADNALEFQVVTAEGNHVTANAKKNPDLFWALAGGGPATFGVVTRVTMKTHSEIPSVGMILNITSQQTNYWKGISIFNSMTPNFVDAGMYVWYAFTATGQFNIQPFVAPNLSRAQFDAVINPFLNALRSNNITFTHDIQEHATFYTLYQAMFAKANDRGMSQTLMGGRLFTRDDIKTSNDAIVSAFKAILENPDGGRKVIGGHVVNPGHGVPNVNNGVSPLWRNVASHNLVIVPAPFENTWEGRKELEGNVTNVYGKLLRDAAPKSGSYVNEGDVNEVDWQHAFWGSNYPRLLRIKEKWDPKRVFYARSTPGTEGWAEINDGRLCRKR